MSEVFISYARSTEAEARRIADALRALGYGVWRDDELPAHRPYGEVIEERLRAAKAVLVLWSAEAVKSQWVRAEAEVAREAGTLVQASLDEVTLPLPFNQIQCADLGGWAGDVEAPGWRKAVMSVADLVGERQGAPGPAPLTTPAARRASICVLPFANMSDEAQQEYFSDGISEDIITDLSKVSALFVTARNTAFTFKGRSVKVPDVARELGVSHVLEGSVRKAGGRVRITAQLVEGETGGHVWAERYDRDLTDIFALQDEISQAVVAALKLKLLPREKQAIGKRGTTSAEAYDFYLMARQYRDAGNWDERNLDTIIRVCERAVALDPNYAQAWALMAAAQATLSLAGRTGDGGAAAVAQALVLDPNLGEAHALKARLLYRAGRRDDAFGELDLALQLDPESYEVNSRAAAIYYGARRFADAARYYGKAAALSETSFGAAAMALSALTALGDKEGARRAARVTLERAEKALAQDPSNGRAMTKGVQALAALGERERARNWIGRALLIDPHNPAMQYDFACTLSLYLEDAEGALELLGSVLARPSAHEQLRLARTDPDLDPIRNNPRFQAMLAEAEARLAPASPNPSN